MASSILTNFTNAKLQVPGFPCTRCASEKNLKRKKVNKDRRGSVIGFELPSIFPYRMNTLKSSSSPIEVSILSTNKTRFASLLSSRTQLALGGEERREDGR